MFLFEKTPADIRDVLTKPIRDLNLKIEGSSVERYVQQLYRDNYKPIPFSRRFVRHMEGWYAQKHPDEDFAETFAVWMTPRSNWRKRYKGWGAMAKLKYMDRVGRKFGDVDPLRPQGDTDITVDDISDTVEQ